MAFLASKKAVEIIETALEALAIICAGWWFLYTTQFKPRIQFDIQCQAFALDLDKRIFLAEIALTFENKGFVEHRIHDLALSVHGITYPDPKTGTSESADFTTCLFPRQVIVPAKYNWYFVRPGVRQTITHPVLLENPGTVIRVTAGFNYKKDSQWPHTARRFFAVTATGRSQSQ